MKRQISPGIDYGLSIALGPINKTNQYPTGLAFPPYGLKILIHNYTFPPLFFETYQSISPGKETNVIVERIVTSNAPKPFSDCIDLANGFNSDVYNWMIKQNMTYRQKDCIFYRLVKFYFLNYQEKTFKSVKSTKVNLANFRFRF